MIQYSEVHSSGPKPQYWSDEVHDYVLIEQHTEKTEDMEGNELEEYISTYNQYSKDEFMNLITRRLKEETAQELDNSLEAVKAAKIAESKSLLEAYYATHPLFSTVHVKDGAFYSITSKKQSYLMSMINLVDQAKALDETFIPTWNATGEPSEVWDERELRTLSLQIAEAVYPKVAKQQEYEKIIQSLEQVEAVHSLIIDYED